ncbi:dmX-like protein 2, partial [Lampetra fluviatilis]
MHVFQEDFILGHRHHELSTSHGGTAGGAGGRYGERFFLVLLEKEAKGLGTTLGMWSVALRSPKQPSGSSPCLRVSSRCVFREELPLPPGVEITCAAPAAGHLSSSSIYPVCLAPYLLLTACSDGSAIFWRCRTSPLAPRSPSGAAPSPTSSTSSSSSYGDGRHDYGYDDDGGGRRDDDEEEESEDIHGCHRYVWEEWPLISCGGDDEPAGPLSSRVHVPGLPQALGCSYTGRLALAYTAVTPGVATAGEEVEEGDGEEVEGVVSVTLFECESTGGSEWVVEQNIALRIDGGDEGPDGGGKVARSGGGSV